MHVSLRNNPAVFYNPDSEYQSINVLRVIAEKETQLRTPYCVKNALTLGKEANILASQVKYVNKHIIKY